MCPYRSPPPLSHDSSARVLRTWCDSSAVVVDGGGVLDKVPGVEKLKQGSKIRKGVRDCVWVLYGAPE